MSSDGQLVDHEPVTPARRRRDAGPEDSSFRSDPDGLRPARRRDSDEVEPTERAAHVATASAADPTTVAVEAVTEDATGTRRLPNVLRLKRAHALTYAGLFLFTFVLYFRPYEYLPLPTNLAFVVALVTLLVFVPSQLSAEGTLTARPREVNLLLLLSVTALLSIPLAISPGEAWATFTGVFLKVAIIFVAMINAVRTRRRLAGLIFLSLAVGCYLSVAALNDYRLGRLAVEGYRVKGTLGGMFDNPNDMAIHLVTMIPLAVALLFAARNALKKLAYAAATGMMMAGVVVTFSRGAFLGLAASFAVLAYKLGRRNRVAVFALAFVVLVGFMLLAPGNYANRLLSIFDHSRDAFGSASARQAILIRSIVIALHNPVFGVGMGNFHIVSISELVSHNSYTQVAAEMGFAALVIYVMFIVSPLRRLARIERETLNEGRERRYHHLAVGLQASLAAYMVSSFFGSVAYLWYAYYLVGYAVCLRRMYEAEAGAPVRLESELKAEEKKRQRRLQLLEGESTSATT